MKSRSPGAPCCHAAPSRRLTPWGFVVLASCADSVLGEFQHRRLRVDASGGPEGSLFVEMSSAHSAEAVLRSPTRSHGSTRSAADELLQFLEGRSSSSSSSTELPSYEDFLPACISHLKKVVQGVDRAYTDEQLRTVLENECSLDKQFSSVESGFGNREACAEFAKTLTAARMKELDSGSMEGYQGFCKQFYKHKGGKIVTTTTTKATTTTPAPAGEDESEANATKSAEKKAHGEVVGSSKKEGDDAAGEGRSKEGAKAAAQDAAEESEAAPEEAKDRAKQGHFPIWPVALIVIGILLFIAGGLVMSRKKQST